MRRFAKLAAVFLIAGTAAPVFAQTAVDVQDKTIAAPPLGVPVEPERGLFADVQVGTFFTIGGDAGVGNGQAYFGLGLGGDLTDNIAIGGWVSYGASSGTCFGNPGTGCDNGASDFSITFANVFFNYLHPVMRQLYIGGRVAGGMALMSASPVSLNVSDANLTKGSAAFTFGFNGGVLLTTEYHAYLSHFIIGLDVGGHFLLGGNAAFPGIAIYPRLKYVF